MHSSANFILLAVMVYSTLKHYSAIINAEVVSQI